MRRILLTIAYDGTAYCGWQIQKNGLSVEEVVERELSSWLKEDITLISASRTDAGVHAEGSRAAFDTNTRIPGEKYAFGLNTSLPSDIRITGSKEVPLSFHPRFTETVKTYEYRIWNSTFENPLKRLYSLHVYGKLDTAKMQQAADLLTGEHDFRSFAAAGFSSKTTVRNIHSVSVEKEDEHMLVIRVKGNGFLYNMVRIIAGTLICVGKGELLPADIPAILAARDRNAAGPTAPAHGLTLAEILYPELGEI